MGPVSQHEMPETQVKLVVFATEQKNNRKRESTSCVKPKYRYGIIRAHTESERNSEQRTETETEQSLWDASSN